MKLFVSIVIAFVCAAIVAALVLVGSPLRERDRKFDQLRVGHLQAIQSRIFSYWQTNGSLPHALSNLAAASGGFSLPVDPTTGAAYEYQKKSDLSFSLCASFATIEDRAIPIQSAPPFPNKMMGMMGPFLGSETAWNHGVGRVCFDETVNPQALKQ